VSEEQVRDKDFDALPWINLSLLAYRSISQTLLVTEHFFT